MLKDGLISGEVFTKLSGIKQNHETSYQVRNNRLSSFPTLIPDPSLCCDLLEKKAINYLETGNGEKSTISAITAFLGQKTINDTPAYSINTQQLYERELYKLHQFMLYNGIPDLLSFSRNDPAKFTNWLKNPPSHLVSSKGRKAPRNHPEWRLFSGPQSQSSIASTHRVVKSFFSFLRTIGVIRVNPWALTKEDKKEKTNQTEYNKEKTLHKGDIEVIQMYLDATGNHSDIKVKREASRHRWIFFSFLLLGLRASELINANTSQLIQKEVAGETFWKIKGLVGKGGSKDSVIVPGRFIEEMKLYRESLGKPPLPLPNDKDPFVFDYLGQKPLSTRQQIYNQYKKLMKRVCMSSFAQSEEQKVRLLGTSPHSLRHTFVTNLLDVTNDISAVKTLARHAKVETTMAYDDTPDLELNRLAEEMVRQKL
jgi:integrase